MKVALVAEWLDAWRGGAETSTLQFMHHLMDRGVELHVYTRSRPSPTPGLVVHTISGASMSRTRRSVTFTTRADRLLEEQDYDVVHAVTPCRNATIYQPRGGTVAETVERNLALRRHAATRSLKRCANRFNFKQQYMLGLERELFHDPHGPVVIAISDYVVEQLKRHYSLPDRRIRKIFNGVDDRSPSAETARRDRGTVRKEFGIGEDDCLVLTIAHNFRLKGVAQWMEAMALLRRRGVTGVRALVIGDGDADRWHRLAARLEIADRLTFTGPTDRINAFLHAGDLLVHPTFYDPCSRVVLEALISGLPCITTRWDGAAEVIENGVNGFVLDAPDDIAALADCVERLTDETVRRRAGLAARQVKDRISMARHAGETIALYHELAVLYPASPC